MPKPEIWTAEPCVLHAADQQARSCQSRMVNPLIVGKYHFLLLVSLVLRAMKVDNRAGFIEFDGH